MPTKKCDCPEGAKCPYDRGGIGDRCFIFVKDDSQIIRDKSSQDRGPIRDYYSETIERIEPDISMIDDGAFNASAAISLKRIADALEEFNVRNKR
jgi:hypothetical protein